jgi:hypothetical protein
MLSQERKNTSMLTGAQNRRPNYFLVAFGRLHADTDPVDGGVYPHLTDLVTSSGIQAGDVMILYCTAGYPGHDKEAPAIGMVTGLTQNQTDPNLTDIHYQYLPLSHPIPLHHVRASIPNLRTMFIAAKHLLQDIGPISFRAAVAGRQIDWP